MNKTGVFETTYKLLSADCDRYGNWRMDRILVLLQELAGEHSGILGCDRADTIRMDNAIWILTRTEFAVFSYPTIAQTLVCKTFPAPPRRGIYPRYYQVEDQQGHVMLAGSSFWVLVDVDSRGMVDPEGVKALMPDTSGLTPYFRRPGAPEMLQGEQVRRVNWQPLYTDIDRNGHVNNTRAADWALCLVSEQADLQQHPVKSLAASYHKEIMPGDKVELVFQLEGLNFSLLVTSQGEDALRLSGSLF